MKEEEGKREYLEITKEYKEGMFGAFACLEFSLIVERERGVGGEYFFRSARCTQRTSEPTLFTREKKQRVPSVALPKSEGLSESVS